MIITPFSKILWDIWWDIIWLVVDLPLWKYDFVSWDYSSQYMESQNPNVPNHQAVILWLQGSTKTYGVYRSQVNFKAKCADPSPINHGYWRKKDRRYHKGVPHFVCSGKINYFKTLRLRWQSFYELLFRHVGIKPTRYILIQVNDSIKVVWTGRNPD